MRVTFMHHFHTKVGTVDNVGPSIDHTSFRINNGLVEIEAVQVESHGRNTHSSQPDSNHRPGGQEKVKSTGVVEGSVLEDKTTKVSVGGDNVCVIKGFRQTKEFLVVESNSPRSLTVRFFFLSELVSIVGRFVFRSSTNQGRRHQRTVHGREKRSAKNTGNASHVEGVHQDVVFGLEYKHKVESSRDSKGHTITERPLANGVVEEDSSSGSNGSRKGGEDPGTHAQTVRKSIRDPCTRQLRSKSAKQPTDILHRCTTTHR